MKKIVFYGVENKELRYKAERYLEENNIIVGYTDSFYKEDIILGKRFIPIEELAEEEFDYIVVLTKKQSSLAQIKENLKILGISERKIISSSLLCNEALYYSPDLLYELRTYLQEHEECGKDTDMDAVLGMSYSFRGLDEKRLKGNFYDFSWHGMDLYYNFRLLKEAGRINTALLCFPYYYFDWDMSMSIAMAQGENLWALRGFHDWHNAKQNTDVSEYIINYELFGRKLFAEVGGEKFCRTYFETVSFEQDTYELGSVWRREYAETYKENILIIDEMLAYLTEMNARIIFVVPPTLCLPCFKSSSKLLIEAKKNRFYNVLYKMKMKYDFEIVDVFDCFQEYRYWADRHHLNEIGKQLFTNYINRIL